MVLGDTVRIKQGFSFVRNLRYALSQRYLAYFFAWVGAGLGLGEEGEAESFRGAIITVKIRARAWGLRWRLGVRG
eukprot:86288-Amorphochlora_amoeboformis.AAC.1